MGNFLGRVFGKKESAPSTPDIINKLRDTEDMLLKKQKFLEQKVEIEVSVAKKSAKTKKRAALAALKRKKRFETQLRQIDGTFSTIEMQREALESEANNTTLLLMHGAMKKAHNNCDVDNVHDMMDDIAEQQDVAEEISEAISNPVAFSQDYDEDDLLAELHDLGEELEFEEQDKLDQQMLNIGPAVRLHDAPRADPVAPVAPLKSEARREEEDPASWANLADLASWAN